MRFVVLDRDGVVNIDSSDYICSPKQWQPIPNSLEALRRLKLAGIRVFICTNQSGLARGYFDETTLKAIHEKMNQAITQAGGAIEKIYICPHHPNDHCLCRKPQPGLLRQLAQDYTLELSNQLFVGDKLSDMQAASAAGMRGILIAEQAHPDYQTYPDLLCAVEQELDLKP